ncbi:diguanylate cyclase [Frankia sp. QA3]|uniref:diguanylate cyclase n=1 Tax=Frankia sp. QA3 TaxID=710111 RepID=UPI000269CBA2|nr:diguanylate cyclase [Frankia sp. QA3]EIV95467.1 diguanylate cyclase (GGDEF) domain-containing protein [Frankia sp. QA3]
MPAPQRRAWPGHAWLAYLCAGLVAVIGYVLPPAAGTGLGFRTALYLLVGLSAAGALLAGPRRCAAPVPRCGWGLLAGSQVLYAGTGAALSIHSDVSSVTVGVAADIVLLLRYPLLVAGLLALLRARGPGRSVASLLDTAMLLAAGFLLSWVYLAAPAVRAEGASAAGIVPVVCAAAGLAVAGVTIRLATGDGERPATLLLLAGGVLVSVAADAVEVFARIGDTGVGGMGGSGGTTVDGRDAARLVSALLLAAAALHPSLARSGQSVAVPAVPAVPVRDGWRLAALCGVGLVGPVVLGVQAGRGDLRDVGVIAVVSAGIVLLIITRMARLEADQRHLAITDGLTGLRTRRYLEAEMRVAARRARRVGSGMGLLLVDVDHFKSVNDRFGHPAGDQVLTEVARRLLMVTRPGDVVARYGGEEFALLALDVRGDALADIAERLRLGVGREPVEVALPAPTAAASADWSAASPGVGAAPAAGVPAPPDGTGAVVRSGGPGLRENGPGEPVGSAAPAPGDAGVPMDGAALRAAGTGSRTGGVGAAVGESGAGSSRGVPEPGDAPSRGWAAGLTARTGSAGSPPDGATTAVSGGAVAADAVPAADALRAAGSTATTTDGTGRRGAAGRLRTVAGAGASSLPVPVTVSVGGAVLPDHADDVFALVAAADRALYAAKEAGRDRVAIGPEGSVPAGHVPSATPAPPDRASPRPRPARLTTVGRPALDSPPSRRSPMDWPAGDRPAADRFTVDPLGIGPPALLRPAVDLFGSVLPPIVRSALDSLGMGLPVGDSRAPGRWMDGPQLAEPAGNDPPGVPRPGAPPGAPGAPASGWDGLWAGDDGEVARSGRANTTNPDGTPAALAEPVAVDAATSAVAAAVAAVLAVEPRELPRRLPDGIECLRRIAEQVDAWHAPRADGRAVAHWLGEVLTVLGYAAVARHRARLAGRLHNVGKILLPPHVLARRGPLDVEEWRLIRMHPLMGANLLAQVPGLRIEAEIVAQQREWFGGGGYPNGIAGSRIRMEARALAVCTAWAAMRGGRGGRDPLSGPAAREQLLAGRATQFDPMVVDVFLALESDRRVGLPHPGDRLTTTPAARAATRPVLGLARPRAGVPAVMLTEGD